MEQTTEERIELTPRQKLVGNLVAGGFTLLCGIFLLLCGLGVIPLSLRDVALPAVLSAVGLALFSTAILNRNSVSLWLSWAFFTPAVISFVAAYTSLGYGNLYPFYIAIPAIASLMTLPMTPKSWKSHIKVIMFFGVLAFLFMLNSLIGIGWNIVLPIILVLAGLAIIAVALSVALPRGKQNRQ